MDGTNKRVVFRITVPSRHSILLSTSRVGSGGRLRFSGLTLRRTYPRIGFLPFQVRGWAGFLSAFTARRRLDQSRLGGAR